MDERKGVGVGAPRQVGEDAGVGTDGLRRKDKGTKWLELGSVGV